MVCRVTRRCSLLLTNPDYRLIDRQHAGMPITKRVMQLKHQKPDKRKTGRPSFDEADGHAAEVFRQEGRRIVLSRDDAAPLWQQLCNQLENLIYSGKIAPRSRIPSETALCEIFRVSRPVVRKALGALSTRGLVVKLPRKGMFVGNPPRETDCITSNLSLFEDMAARGVRVSTKTFELIRTEPDDRERESLELGPGEEIVRVGRVFWIDDRPITCTRMSFPATKVQGLETLDVEGRSIFGLVRERYGRRPHRAERWFAATMPDAETAERMGVPAEIPMIWIESIAYEADGTPLEYYRAHYNSDTARIHVSVSE